MQPVDLIRTAHLFPELHARLMELLRACAPADWQQPTVCAPWTVQDLAAHLLGGDIGRLSSQRDGYQHVRGGRLEGFDSVLAYLNQSNAEWVQAARRISPRLLTDLLDLTGRQACELFASLDPHAEAPVAVLWAGEERSLNWFDVAREYAERWNHQQQLRDALTAPPLSDRRLCHPALDTFLRALPHTYRDVAAPAGTLLAVRVEGEAGGDWSLVRDGAAWRLYAGRAPQAIARARMDQDTAWRLFTKGLSPEEARRRVRIEGDADLGAHLLRVVSIMA